MLGALRPRPQACGVRSTRQGGCHTGRALSHRAEMAFHDSKLADVCGDTVSGLGALAPACLLPGA